MLTVAIPMTAEMAASEEGLAAIGSTLGAELYGLKIVFANIEDNPLNQTRFFVISTTPAKRTGSDKTAIMFTTAHKAGALVEVLNVFSRHGINRTDSMPLAKCSFETVDSTLIKAALWGEYDSMAGISANIMLGQLPPCGTADSDILLDVERLAELLPEDATADPTFDRGPIQGDAAPPGPAFHAIDAAPPVVTAAIPAARRTVTYAATNYTIEDDA